MAVVTTCVALLPIGIGAIVTTTGAGMAFSDWPTSDGHLLNPPHWWQQSDTRWEHGHRLLAVLRLGDIVDSNAPEKLSDDQSHGPVIVDHQDADRGIVGTRHSLPHGIAGAGRGYLRAPEVF